MAEITAALVKDLREKTGVGMMDCKKALAENNGDLEASVDWLRAKGLSKAAKKADRAAAEGLVAVALSGTKGAAIELNSETDFVARNADFQKAAIIYAKLALDADNLAEQAANTLLTTIGEDPSQEVLPATLPGDVPAIELDPVSVHGEEIVIHDEREHATAGQTTLRREEIVRVPGARDPLAAVHPWYVLLETSGLKEDGTAERLLIGALEAATERGLILDAAMASSLTQARDFWRLREAISEAQKPEGGNIKHDVSVPVARIPEFVRAADAAVLALCPGARPIAVGHFGDGNVHYNIAQPIGMEKTAFMALQDQLNDAVHAIVLAMSGSIAAEHGVGRLKREELARTKSAVEIDLNIAATRQIFDISTSDNISAGWHRNKLGEIDDITCCVVGDDIDLSRFSNRSQVDDEGVVTCSTCEGVVATTTDECIVFIITDQVIYGTATSCIFYVIDFTQASSINRGIFAEIHQHASSYISKKQCINSIATVDGIITTTTRNYIIHFSCSYIIIAFC